MEIVIENDGLDLLQEIIEQAGENLPEIASEIIIMGRIEATLMVAFLLIVILLTFKTAYKFIMQEKENRTLYCMFYGVAIVLPLLLSIRDAVLSWFFPRLYIVEYLK